MARSRITAAGFVRPVLIDGFQSRDGRDYAILDEDDLFKRLNSVIIGTVRVIRVRDMSIESNMLVLTTERGLCLIPLSNVAWMWGCPFEDGDGA